MKKVNSYKSLQSALKHCPAGYCVFHCNNIDDDVQHPYRVCHYDYFKENYKGNELYSLITWNFGF